MPTDKMTLNVKVCITPAQQVCNFPLLPAEEQKLFYSLHQRHFSRSKDMRTEILTFFFFFFKVTPHFEKT